MYLLQLIHVKSIEEFDKPESHSSQGTSDPIGRKKIIEEKELEQNLTNPTKQQLKSIDQIKVLKEIHFPHSLGLLYSAFTYYTGFKVNSGEYKVMGLAPYGTPKYSGLIKENLIKINDDGSYLMVFESVPALAIIERKNIICSKINPPCDFNQTFEKTIYRNGERIGNERLPYTSLMP